MEKISLIKADLVPEYYVFFDKKFGYIERIRMNYNVNLVENISLWQAIKIWFLLIKDRLMTRIIQKDDDPVVYRNRAQDDAFAASTLIYTIVWSIVVLVLLGVGLYALHLYLGWF